MLDAAIVKHINNLREMAMMVVNEADHLLRFETPGGSPPGSFNSGGLSDAQRVKLLNKRRKNIAASLVRQQNKSK